MAKLVSKVYGDALFEAAMERDMLSPVYEEVQSLQTILMENADLVQFLNHPQIIKEEKLKVVENIFKGRVSDDLMGFLETVIEKGRQKELPKILDYFVNRVKEYKKDRYRNCHKRGRTLRGAEGPYGGEAFGDHSFCESGSYL